MKSPSFLASTHESQSNTQRQSQISSYHENKLICLDSVKDGLSSDDSSDDDNAITNFR